MAAARTTLLLTGFEPFAGDAENPSRDIAKALDDRRVGTATVRSLVLPVQHEAAAAVMIDALARVQPLAVVHLGLANGRARISLEQVAVNVMDYRIPDAHGRIVRGEPCVAGGPPAYFATLPARAILAELTADGIPAHLSYTAGTYLCNYVLYATLHALAGSAADTRAGFVHLPFLPSMVAAHGLEEPSMDLPLMIRAVETALRVVAAS
jgi:pyroglutamyl-peptidase